MLPVHLLATLAHLIKEAFDSASIANKVIGRNSVCHVALLDNAHNCEFNYPMFALGDEFNGIGCIGLARKPNQIDEIVVLTVDQLGVILVNEDLHRVAFVQEVSPLNDTVRCGIYYCVKGDLLSMGQDDMEVHKGIGLDIKHVVVARHISELLPKFIGILQKFMLLSIPDFLSLAQLGLVHQSLHFSPLLSRPFLLLHPHSLVRHTGFNLLSTIELKLLRLQIRLLRLRSISTSLLSMRGLGQFYSYLLLLFWGLNGIGLARDTFSRIWVRLIISLNVLHDIRLWLGHIFRGRLFLSDYTPDQKKNDYDANNFAYKYHYLRCMLLMQNIY